MRILVRSRALVACLLPLLAAGCATTAPPAAPPAPPVMAAPPVPPAPPPPAPPASMPPAAAVPPPVPLPTRIDQPVPSTLTEPSPGRPTLATSPPATAAPTAPPVAPAQRGRFVVLNFDNADIETVVHAAAEIAGFNYVLAPDVKGKVTVQTSGRIAQEDVFGVLLAVLEVHGFTAVKSGSLYKIVRIEGARERAVPTVIGTAPDRSREGDEVLTQIVPLRYASVADLSSLLRPLMSPRGALVAHRETNVLLVTDTASNVARLLDIVRLVDVELSVEEIHIMPLRFADAADLAGILTQLVSTGRLRRSAGAGPGGVAPAPLAPLPAPAAGVAARPAVPGGPTVTETGGTERAPLIIGERRSNSLIVHARRQEVEMIEQVVRRLDVDVYAGRRVFIYYAENAKAKDLAGTLSSIYGGASTTSTPSTGPGSSPSMLPSTARPPSPPTGAPGGAPTSGLGDLGVTEGQVRFIADETTNAVIVATVPRYWAEIEATIKQLDRMPRQVLVEVLVAEVTLTDDMRLGMDWALRSGSFRVASQNIGTESATIASPSTFLPPAAALALPAAGLTAFAFDSQKFFAMLNALASVNRVNVLSNPHVMTSENKKAVINVSDSIPIVTSQQVPFGGTTTPTATNTTSVIGTQTVEYKDAGVILTVTPRIGERGTVALDVKQEVNDIGAAEPPTGSRRIIKREAETSVVLVNDQTLVLGGLIRDQQVTDNTGIPFLKDIPVLGYLFGRKIRTNTKTELILLVKPHVIGSPLDAARVTEEMRRSTKDLEEAIKRAPRQPSPGPEPAAPVPAPR